MSERGKCQAAIKNEAAREPQRVEYSHGTTENIVELSSLCLCKQKWGSQDKILPCTSLTVK